MLSRKLKLFVSPTIQKTVTAPMANFVARPPAWNIVTRSAETTKTTARMTWTPRRNIGPSRYMSSSRPRTMIAEASPKRIANSPARANAPSR